MAANIRIVNNSARDIIVSVPISNGDTGQDGGYSILHPGQANDWNRPGQGDWPAFGATAFVVGAPFETEKHPAVFYIQPGGDLIVLDHHLNWKSYSHFLLLHEKILAVVSLWLGLLSWFSLFLVARNVLYFCKKKKKKPTSSKFYVCATQSVNDKLTRLGIVYRTFSMACVLWLQILHRINFDMSKFRPLFRPYTLSESRLTESIRVWC